MQYCYMHTLAPCHTRVCSRYCKYSLAALLCLRPSACPCVHADIGQALFACQSLSDIEVGTIVTVCAVPCCIYGSCLHRFNLWFNSLPPITKTNAAWPMQLQVSHPINRFGSSSDIRESVLTSSRNHYYMQLILQMAAGL